MTRFCTCPGSLASSLEYSRKRNKLAGVSCKNCGGRFVVDGLGPLSRNMHGTVGLEVSTSIDPEFNWKIVTKGKRSRKAVARCMNRGAELGNKSSPKRVGDFSGSDSDKFGETANGQCFSDKVEYAPLKKRRHFFRSLSPSSQPQLYGRDLVSPQLPTSTSHSENFEHLSDHNGSSGSYTNRLLGRVGNGLDGAVSDKSDKVSGLTSGVFYNSDNFSGIALLAAAACINNIDEDTYNDKVDALEVSSAPQRSDDASTSSLRQREIGHDSESGQQVDMQVSGLKGCSFGVDDSVEASHNSSGSEDLKSVSLKVDRLHWDLNTLMDAWEQPNYDEDNGKDDNYLYVPNVVVQIMKLDKEGCVNESVSRNTENDAEGCLPVDQIENAVECSLSKLEGNDSEELCSSHDRAGIKETRCSSLNGNSSQRLDFCSADTKFSGHILNSSESIDNSPKTESCYSSEVSGQYLDTRSDCVAVTQGEGGSRNVIATQSASLSDHKVTLCDDSDSGKYGCEIDAQKEVAQDSQKITELPGNLTSLGQEMCIGSCKTLDAENSESILGNDSHPSSKYASVTTSDISVGGESGGYSDAKGQHLKVLAANVLGIDTGENQGSKVILSEYEDPQLSNGEAEGMCILEDLGKDFVPEDHQNFDVSEEDVGPVDARENIAELDVGYDSPYEDGELRGSVLYSWEGNEFEVGEEHEYLDYESDGRGGEDSDAGEFSDPKIMEADSEGIEKRSLLAIPVQETDSMKSCSARSSSRRELENANTEKTDPTGEKASNQGSGTTEELTAVVITEGNYGSVRRRHTSNHMDVLNVKGSGVGEAGSKTIRGKLQSRIEGSIDTSERDVAYSRSHDGGTFLRAKRDGSPDRFGTGYRSAAHHRERRGDNQCVYWDSSNRGPSGYRGPDGHGLPRQRTGIAKFGAVDSRDQKHSLNYSSRTDRDGSPDNFTLRCRSAVQERGRNSHLTYWDPRMRYSSSYRGPKDDGQARPRSVVFDSVDKFGGFNSYDRKQSINYSSKSTQRPPCWRRSPIDRDDYHGGLRRMAGFSSSGNRGGGGKFSEGVVLRGFREEYHQPVNDDDASSDRMPHVLSWRRRNFFSHSTRGAHVLVQRRSSRSRSRTRSPHAWQPQRECDLGIRRHSRSPDFRSESRMDRMRAPFQKPSFGADYGDSFMSPPRGRFSPQRNFRRADDRNVVDSHLRQRRSPFNMFRQNQRLDSVCLSGRLKSDDSFRPIMRPGRFTPTASAGRGCKLEDSNEDKGHDERSGTMH